MIELLFFIACGCVAMLPTLIGLGLKRPAIAALLALAWFAGSVELLWTIGLDPHGFILFAFIPFWAGNVAGLIWALLRFNKERVLA